MTTSARDASRLELLGMDGANPLGFLAALGTVVILRDEGEIDVRLGWTRGFKWTAVLEGIFAADSGPVVSLIAEHLRGAAISLGAEEARQSAQGEFDREKKAVADKKLEIRNRGLRGRELKAALEDEVRPLEGKRDRKRSEWLRALAQAVPRPELALGRHVDCTGAEYREHARFLLARASLTERDPADLLAAFASDACVGRNGRVQATPFCFVTGSGHQYFLDTVRQLIERVEPERVRQTLFEPWRYEDRKLSLRWDPTEDRRYALTDRDPSDEATRTVWMANLLAYRSLVLFPSVPTRSGLVTTGWNISDGESAFTWPIWERPVGIDGIRSLLQLRELAVAAPDHQSLLARGVLAAFRARRIKVGEGGNAKFNFSGARAV